MSTRARIGILEKNGSVKSVSTHYDGGPGYMGKTLKKHYSKPEDAKKLLSKGKPGIITLEEDIKTTEFGEPGYDSTRKDKD